MRNTLRVVRFLPHALYITLTNLFLNEALINRNKEWLRGVQESPKANQ